MEKSIIIKRRQEYLTIGDIKKLNKGDEFYLYYTDEYGTVRVDEIVKFECISDGEVLTEYGWNIPIDRWNDDQEIDHLDNTGWTFSVYKIPVPEWIKEESRTAFPPVDWKGDIIKDKIPEEYYVDKTYFTNIGNWRIRANKLDFTHVDINKKGKAFITIDNNKKFNGVEDSFSFTRYLKDPNTPMDVIKKKAIDFFNELTQEH